MSGTALEIRLQAICVAILGAPFVWGALKLWLSWETNFGISQEKRRTVYALAGVVIAVVAAFNWWAAIHG